MFIKKSSSEFAIIAVYVDGMNLIGTLEELEKIVVHLKLEFEIWKNLILSPRNRPLFRWYTDVDDMNLIGTPEELEKIVVHLKLEFEIKDLGKIRYFLLEKSIVQIVCWSTNRTIPVRC